MDYTLKLIKETDDHAVFGGYGVVFGGEDLTGETFTAETFFGKRMGKGQEVYIDHSLPSTVKLGEGVVTLKGIDDPIGEIIEVSPDDVGLYMELMIEKASPYWEIVDGMHKTKRLGLSTGTASHLKRPMDHGGAIERWPIKEVSLTLTPAEPRTVGVQRVKSDLSVEQGEEPEAEPSETAGTAVADPQRREPATVEIIENSDEVRHMNLDNFATKDEVKGIDDKLTKILDALAESPKLKDAGFISPDSEEDRPEAKSFVDFLFAIRRGNTRRLKTVYQSTKDMSGTTGEGGGYLVPEEYGRFMSIENSEDPIISRVFRQPVTRPSGEYPALDVFTAVTAGSGDTPYSGGLTPDTIAEGGTYGESQPEFTMLRYQVSKIGELVDVPSELVADSALPIQALLQRLFRIAINNKLTRHVIRGTGVGQPQGILNAACAVPVTPASNNTFGEADALTMFSRFRQIDGNANSAVWLMHRGVIPDLLNFTSSGQDLVEWRQQLPTAMLGFPIILSDHMPQDDNAGSVILADLSAYVLFDRQDLRIDFSEHYRFGNDLVSWRYDIRADGMPWLKNAITLPDPQGSYTVSPFVYHND